MKASEIERKERELKKQHDKVIESSHETMKVQVEFTEWFKEFFGAPDKSLLYARNHNS